MGKLWCARVQYLTDDSLEGRATGSRGFGEEKIFKAWYAERYHAPADDLGQPVDVAAAAQFNAILEKLALRVADADQRPQWRADSFFRRFAQ